jgi:hypothetical protein
MLGDFSPIVFLAFTGIGAIVPNIKRLLLARYRWMYNQANMIV